MSNVSHLSNAAERYISHVDALLYIQDYLAAAKALDEYDLKPTDDIWIAYEWGRTHLGNDQYKQAMEIFRGLAAREDADIHYHVFYTRCLQYMGHFVEGEKAARSTVANYPDAHAAHTTLGTTLEQNGKLDEAVQWLEPLLAERDDNIQAAASLMRDRSRTLSSSTPRKTTLVKHAMAVGRPLTTRPSQLRL